MIDKSTYELQEIDYQCLLSDLRRVSPDQANQIEKLVNEGKWSFGVGIRAIAKSLVKTI